jgi:molecular chaperone GrpE (heat shock protein)
MEIDFFNSIPNIVEIFTVMAFIVSFCAWLYKVWINRISVKRVKKKTDDLYEALELYRVSFNDKSVMDSSEEMENWIAQISELNKSNETKWIIYLYIVKTKHDVIGFFYAEYNKVKKYLLISYIAVDKEKSKNKKVTEKIAKRLKRELRSSLKDCKGIIFELEMNSDNNEEESSKFRLFNMVAKKFNVTLKRLKIEYIQPNIKPWDINYNERKQILVYGHTNKNSIGNTISKEEYIDMLDALYNEWYVSAYEDSSEHYEGYKEYIKNLFEKSVSSLPEKITIY